MTQRTLLILSLALLAHSVAASGAVSFQAKVEKTALEQHLILDQVKVEIQPADSNLIEERVVQLPGGSALWVGVWSEGNRGRHLRAWLYSGKSHLWSTTPFADARSDLKIGFEFSQGALNVQTYRLTEDQQLEAADQPLRFVLARP